MYLYLVAAGRIVDGLHRKAVEIGGAIALAQIDCRLATVVLRVSVVVR